MKKILVATRNFGKFKELMEVLHDLPFKFVSLNDEHISEDIKETGRTYEENAILKAEFFGRLSGLPTIADDSGIIIEALQGELGVATRRWGAGEKATDQEWLDYFLDRMAKETNRKAQFVTVIAFYQPGKPTETFRGECHGEILKKPPVAIEPGIPLSSVFLPNNHTQVFSAMDKNQKNAISHRGQAIHKCKDYLLKIL